MADNKTSIVITAEDKASGPIAQITGALGGIGGASAAASAALASLSAGAALTGLSAMSLAAINAADGLFDLSQRTGIAVKDLAAYKLAAEQSGTSLESVARGVKGLGTAMLENSMALQAAGITAKDADGALRQLADLFSQIPDGPEKLAVGNKLLGKSFQDLVPMLNLGSQGLDESAVAAARYGAAMATLAPVADAFNDNLAALSLNLQAMGAEVANQLAPTLNVVAQAMADTTRESGELSAAGTVLKTVFETVAILGANVAFVFKTTGMEIGAWAAQIAALGRGDFAGFRAISDAVKADAERARAELDKFERRVLNPPKIMSGASTYDARDLRAQADAQAEAYKRWEDLKRAIDGTGKAAKESKVKVQELIDVLGSGSYLTRDKETARAIKESFEFENWANGELAKSREKMAEAADRAEESVRAKIEAMEQETALMGLSTVERERAVMMLSLEAEKANLTADAYETLRARMESALSASAARRATVEAAEESKKYWERAFEDVGRSLSDAIMDGGMSAGELLERYFKTLVLRPVIEGVVGAGISAGMKAVGIDGASGAGNLLSTGSSAYNLLSGGSSLYTSFATSSLGQAAGLSSVVEAGMSSEVVMSQLGSTLGAALPYVAAALAIGSMLMKDGGGPKTEGGVFTELIPGANAFANDKGNYKTFYTRDVADATIQQVLDPLGDGLERMIADLGGSIAGLSIGLGFNTDPQGTADDSVKGSVYLNGGEVYRHVYSSERGTYGQELQNEANRVILAALEAVDLNALAETYLDALDIGGLSGEAAAQAVGFVTASQSIVDAFERVGFSAEDVTYDLIKAMGGFDAAGAAIDAMAQTLDAIAQSAAGTSSMFGNSIRSVKLDVLDDAGKYAFLDDEAARYRDVLASLSDANLIAQYSDKLNGTIMQAWGLLDAPQRQSRADEYVKLLEQADQLALSRYDVARDNVTEQAKEIAAAVKEAVREAMQESVAASSTMSSSADRLAATIAGGIGVSVSLDPGRVEVGFAGT